MRLDPNECLQRLVEGNERFSSGHARKTTVSSQRMADTAFEQHPFAVVIACSDSRSPVEIVFDQSWGDLFVIRVAGNVCSAEVVGSVEYAVEQLAAPLVVVLGHTNCGAVAAAAAASEFSANLDPLLDQIKPAVDKARAQNPSASAEDLAAGAVESNVWLALENLMVRSSIVSHKMRQNQCHLAGAVLDITNGKVKWLGEHPLQAALMMH